MKKIFAILMTICLLVGALSITAFAAEPGSDVVIRVRAQKKNGDIVELENGDFKSFVDGWEAAVDLATNHSTMDKNNYDYVVVDFYANWKADEDGEFGDDSFDGIDNHTIYVPEDTRIVINLNGHTIDRGLGDNNEYDGEVIYVDENARLIINGGKSGDPVVKPGTNPGDVKMGTITGGNSDNGAGGIHVKDGAFLSLNNVHIDGNATDDDCGAGIALYDGASLVMSGGSISNNRLIGTTQGDTATGGALYLNDSEATLSYVEIKNNLAFKDYGDGLAVYADDSTVYLNDCIIDGNGIETGADRNHAGLSIVHADDSTVVVTRTKFTNNGAYVDNNKYYGLNGAVIRGEDRSDITLTECTFTNNSTNHVLDMNEGSTKSNLTATKCDIVDNKSAVLEGYGIFTFESCNFGGNKCPQSKRETFYPSGAADITFSNCLMGDSTYYNLDTMEFINSQNAPSARRFASIFGEGSLTMIVALLALIASGVAIFLVVYYNKKKAVPVAANEATKTEDEE